MTKSVPADASSSSTVPSNSRFGGSVYRPKSSRLFQQPKKSPSSSSVTTPTPNDVTSPIITTHSSEFTLHDAISPVSSYATTTRRTQATVSTTGGNDGPPDLLAEISFDDSRNVSLYDTQSSSSANSSFDIIHSSPTRYPQSKHVSFDGSNISDNPDSPVKASSTSSTSSGRIVSMSPILANDRGTTRASLRRNGSISTSSVDDESAATVPTSNQQVAKSLFAPFTTGVNPTGSSMDETSVSSTASYDEFGVARNAYETSTQFVMADSSKNPFENTQMPSNITTTTMMSTTPTMNSTNPFEGKSEGTNPFDDTEATASDLSALRSSKGSNSARVLSLSSISEQPNASEDNDQNNAVTDQKKASWMTFLRPLNDPSSEEKVDEGAVTTTTTASEMVPKVWTPSKPFEMVNMYQDPNEITPVLFMVESKRQCWFQNEMDSMRREWQYYKKLIRDNVQEVVRVEDMLKSSYDGFVNYVKNIDDMIADLYVNESGELLTKRDKTKMMKRRNGDAGTSTTDGGSSTNDYDYDDANDLNLWLNPMIESFSKEQGEIKTQLPFLEECLLDVIKLKQEMRSRGKELDEKGNTLTLRVMEQAESNIQNSFDALMKVIDEVERKKREEMRKAAKAAASNPTNTGSTSSSVLREFVDESKTDEPTPINDRWLYESQYRYSAKLGLLSWKENRKDYEFWYAEVIALHEERKCRLNEVLLSFLPSRRDLFVDIHKTLMSGSEALDEGKSSSQKEARAIDKAIERNAIQVMKKDPTSNADLTMEAILNPKMKGSSAGVPTKYARSSPDLWKSAIIRERRLVELKVNKDEWKIAVCIVTLDDCMNVFIMTDKLLNDDTTTSTTQPVPTTTTTNPFEESTAGITTTTNTTKPLDYYTKKMSTSVTTRIPPIEYSIKLVDYDISIVGSGGTADDKNSNNKNPFGSSNTTTDDVPTEIDLIRRARSMIFRKREDHITFRVPSKKDAIKFLRNRLPVGERLAEI